MSDCKLTLRPDADSPDPLVELALSGDWEAMDRRELAKGCVNTGGVYRAVLEGGEGAVLTFCVNGLPVPFAEEKRGGGRVCLSFPGVPKGRSAQIFQQHLGLVQLSLRLKKTGGEEVTLYSQFIPVTISGGSREADKAVTASARQMVRYIAAYRDTPFFLNDDMPSRMKGGLRYAATRELNTQIWILREIVRVYNESAGYFRTGAKVKLRPGSSLDSYERVRYVSGRTLSYTARHPEYLMRTAAATGIRAGGRNFLPARTLVEESRVSCDIYENQVVAGFLHSLRPELQRRLRDLDRRAGELKAGTGGSSVDWLVTDMAQGLAGAREELRRLSGSVDALCRQYDRLLPVKRLELRQAPAPSKILMSVQPYRQIYDQIRLWFLYGIYQFGRKEDYIVPMLKTCDLYEYYVLLKLCHYILSLGYRPVRAEAFRYKAPSGWQGERPAGFTQFSGIEIQNTFLFTGGNGREVTLYYEPYIYMTEQVYLYAESTRKNGIGLRRKKLGVNGGTHYCPDYVLKIQDADGRCRYVILDAKFTTQDSVSRNHMKSLMNKYIADTTVTSDGDELPLLIAISGKQERPDEQLISHMGFFDNRSGRVAQILTLTESPAGGENPMPLSAGQKEALDTVLGGYIPPV